MHTVEISTDKLPEFQSETSDFTLGLRYAELLVDLQGLFENVEAERAFERFSSGSLVRPRPVTHEFEGSEKELLALISAIKRLGLRATLIAHAPSQLESVAI